MADIVQLVENGQKKYIKTHIQAVEDLEKELAKYEKTNDLSVGAVAWSGGLLMDTGNTITPSISLDKCKNGWCLIWYRYENGEISNYPTQTFINKNTILGNSAGTISFPIALMQTYAAGNTTSNKLVKYTKATITGHGANVLVPHNKVILKEVVTY